jgi:hypothetical protein
LLLQVLSQGQRPVHHMLKSIPAWLTTIMNLICKRSIH